MIAPDDNFQMNSKQESNQWDGTNTPLTWNIKNGPLSDIGYFHN